VGNVGGLAKSDTITAKGAVLVTAPMGASGTRGEA